MGQTKGGVETIAGKAGPAGDVLVCEGLGFSLLPASCASVFNIEHCAAMLIEQPARRSIGLLETRPVGRTPSLTAFMDLLRERLGAAQGLR